MLADFRLDEIFAQRLQAGVRAPFVGRHQPAVADHVRSQDCGEPARHQSGPMRKSHADDRHMPAAKTSAKRDARSGGRLDPDALFAVGTGKSALVKGLSDACRTRAVGLARSAGVGQASGEETAGPAGFGGAARSSYGDLSAARGGLESGARDRRSSPAMPVVGISRLGGRLPGSSGEDRGTNRSRDAGFGQTRSRPADERRRRRTGPRSVDLMSDLMKCRSGLRPSALADDSVVRRRARRSR
jgi:hypothetical protein